MEKILMSKYPKLILLTISIALAYLIFSQDYVKGFMKSIGEGYLGIAISGFFFSFGFTTPFSVGAFITMNPENLFFAAGVGGFFAMLADLTIFSAIKFSFINEFRKLDKMNAIKKINSLQPTINKKLKNYLLYAFAGIIVASPLPDEIGVSMITWLGKIKPIPLAILTFTLNTIGIFILLNL